MYLCISGHLRKKHLKALNQCCYCGEKRSSTSATMRHIDTVHKGIKRFKCDYCSNAYGQSHELKKHLQICHNKA